MNDKGSKNIQKRAKTAYQSITRAASAQAQLAATTLAGKFNQGRADSNRQAHDRHRQAAAASIGKRQQAPISEAHMA